jgi:transcriptional regulator with XRE-family HTH domain
MGRRIDDVIAKLPKERRKHIVEKAGTMAREMIAHADSLRVVRKALSKTQTEIGEGLGLSQNAVSQLEGRSDLRLSTLRRYVNALGADLELVVRMKNGSKVVLEGLGESQVKAAIVVKSTAAAKKATKRRYESAGPRSGARHSSR